MSVLRRLVRGFRNAKGRAAGYGGCYRCGDTWDWTKSHDTPYTAASACFPLCERCWAALTPTERLPFYDLLVNEWIRQVPSERADYEIKRNRIRVAVRAGG